MKQRTKELNLFLRIVFAVGENIAALANLDTHSVTVVRFCSPSTPSSSASIPSVSKIREMALLLHITSRDEICIGYDKSLVGKGRSRNEVSFLYCFFPC